MKPSMNQITEHVPNFVGMDKPRVSKFKACKKLLEIPWVKSFSEDKDFYRYSLSHELLMAEYKKGKDWWPVGHIKDPTSVDLPKWVER